MAVSGDFFRLIISALLITKLTTIVNGAEIFLEWHVEFNASVNPFPIDDQPVIAINGLFPGPLINATTGDIIHVNVFNNLDEPLLFTWNGIQQRLNSWQDGVSGTNCPIQRGKNWTYVFQVKDQSGTFTYFPSKSFQKFGGGFGPIRVNSAEAIELPFSKPESEFDLLIGDWYLKSYKDFRSLMNNSSIAYHSQPDKILINGKGSYLDDDSKAYENFTVTKGKTYRLRVSNVGIGLSFNFRIQNHKMLLVEIEGSYVNPMTLDSLDVHVGQSYSVLVTADQEERDYYIVATPKLVDFAESRNLVGVGVLHYENYSIAPRGLLPAGPDPFDIDFSIDQANSIRWNSNTGAARLHPQGTFNAANVTLTQSFILQGSATEINGMPRYTINNVSYVTPSTPLKLADAYANGGTGVFELDKFPTNSSNIEAVNGVFVATGFHKGWIEIVFKNDLDVIDTWHLDGFGFFVVWITSDEQWTPNSRSSYNTNDPAICSTIQVYPGRSTAILAYLDNPGMWNLRSQLLKNWYLGQELYLRVHDPDPNPPKLNNPPENLLLCGIFDSELEQPTAAPAISGAFSKQISWFHMIIICTVTIACIVRQ